MIPMATPALSYVNKAYNRQGFLGNSDGNKNRDCHSLKTLYAIPHHDNLINLSFKHYLRKGKILRAFNQQQNLISVRLIFDDKTL